VPTDYRPYCGAAPFAGDTNRFVRDAIRVPNMINASKLFGLLETKPWHNDAIDWPHITTAEGTSEPIKCVLSDTLARQMYFLDPFPEDKTAGINPLISYNWGTDSTQMQAVMNYSASQTPNTEADANFDLKTAFRLSIDGTIENSPVAQAISAIQPEQSDSHLTSIFWQEQPLTFGAFKLDYPCQYPYSATLYFQYQNVVRDEKQTRNIILAGNNTGFIGGWIEGAFISSVNAVSAVLYDITGGDEGFRMHSLLEASPFGTTIGELTSTVAAG